MTARIKPSVDPMDTLKKSTRTDRFIRALTLTMFTWCLLLQAYIPVAQASEPVASSVASTPVASALVSPASSSDAIVSGASLLSGTEMSQTIGAGWWSSFWEGVKENWEEIFWFGVFVAIGVLCHNGEVGCYAQ